METVVARRQQERVLMEPSHLAQAAVVVMVTMMWLTVSRPKNLENQELAWCSMWASVECQAFSSVALACRLKVEASMAKQQWQREQVMEPLYRAVVVMMMMMVVVVAVMMWLTVSRPKNLENQELEWCSM
jgi:preprotein translocase subunit YajC